MLIWSNRYLIYFPISLCLPIFISSLLSGSPRSLQKQSKAMKRMAKRTLFCSVNVTQSHLLPTLRGFSFVQKMLVHPHSAVVVAQTQFYSGEHVHFFGSFWSHPVFLHFFYSFTRAELILFLIAKSSKLLFQDLKTPSSKTFFESRPYKWPCIQKHTHSHIWCQKDVNSELEIVWMKLFLFLNS